MDNDDDRDSLSLWPDFEVDAAEGVADEWLHDEIIRKAVARFGSTVVLTVRDADGARSYPLMSLLGDLALRGAWGEKSVTFGPAP
jgi:hypothetical protein